MKQKAFTLIEVLVVVLIIGILSAFALPQYTKAVEKARAAEAFVVLRNLRDLQEIYYIANGEYASSFEQLGITEPEGNSFTYRIGSISVSASSRSKGYNLAFRYEHRNKTNFPANEVCGYDLGASNEDSAKAWCKKIGADTSVKESVNTWTLTL